MTGPEVADRRFSGRAVPAFVPLAGAGVVALFTGETDPIARWTAFGVLGLGLVFLLRAWRNDPAINADGAGFAACVLAVGVAAPFLLGIIGVLAAFLLVPLATGLFARHWTLATRRSTVTAAWFCGLAIAPLATWFGGRADERPAEGFVAGLLLIAAAGSLAWIRRLERSVRRSSRVDVTPSDAASPMLDPEM